MSELRVADRCDKCGAQAFVHVAFEGGHELLFCGHHYAAHEAALNKCGVTITDERERINKQASASSA